MKFKTKLAITFLTIILLPVLLSLCAFLGIGTIMMRSGGQTTYDEGMRAYSMMSESIDAFSQATDELFDTIQEQARENTHRLEDKAYLDKLNEEAADKSSYIIIRKGDQIYYAGNAWPAAFCRWRPWQGVPQSFCARHPRWRPRSSIPRA